MARDATRNFGNTVGAAAASVLAIGHAVPAQAGDVDALLFGSLDAGAATFLTVGAKLGLGPLDRDGFVMLASFGGGLRAGRRDCGRRTTRYAVGAAAVFGYQWFLDWGVVAAFAGPEGLTEMVVGPQGLAAAPIASGLRLHGEVWARPNDETLLQATAVVGATRGTVWSRIAWGYRLWGTYLGPEVSLYADATGYRKLNLGLHGTDFDLGRYSIRVSAGVQTETGERSAQPYLALAIWSPW